MIVEFPDLLGAILTKIERSSDDDELTLETNDGTRYFMYHKQDCCEHVRIEDIVGDLNDLIGSPIILAEESTDDADSEYGTGTWTFYKLATSKGHVTIRWLGESNGYYGESVYLYDIEKKEN